MTVLGFWVTVAALLASVVATITYYRITSKGAIPTRTARAWVYLSASLVFFASLLLITLLLRNDFSNGYVYSYSSRSLLLHFLISSFYAGQEGSFLFWVLCSAVISLILIKRTARVGIEPWVMTVLMAVNTFLLLLVVAKSPFRFVWEMFPQATAGQVPPDGRGLNPLLQNFWMVIHPPVLFIGFAAMAVPFSFAVAGLWKRRYDLLSANGFAWVLFAVLVLGLGIMLGAYWAYGVLGWGGYWGWDPVENSSLVPWITGVALIHTTLAQRRSNRFLRTNLALAIVSFFLVVYSTFLTRSGILGDSSVHSFVDPGATVYWLLVAFLVVIASAGFGLMYARRIELRTGNAEQGIVSRESMLGIGAIVLLLSAVVILFGTSLPIFSKSSVEPSFYNTVNLPLVMLTSFLIGISLYTPWGIGELAITLKKSLKAIAVALIGSALLWFFGLRDSVMLLFACAALFAFFVNGEVGSRILRGDPRFLGGKLAHIGLALFFLGVISTGKYSSSKHISLPLNTPQEALGHTLTYVGYTPQADGKFAFNVVVEKDGKQFQLSPIMFEAGEQGIMRNPDIASFLTSDFYLSPVSLDQSLTDAGHGHETYTIQKGQTVSIGDVQAKFVKFDLNQHGSDAMMQGNGGMAIGSVLELSNGTTKETVTPVAVYQQNSPPTYKSSASKLVNANIQLVSMNVGMEASGSTITVEVQRPGKSERAPEALVVEASIKPFINLVWGGTIVMMVGFVLSILKRSKEN